MEVRRRLLGRRETGEEMTLLCPLVSHWDSPSTKVKKRAWRRVDIVSTGQPPEAREQSGDARRPDLAQ